MCQMTYPNHEELIDAINSTPQTKKKKNPLNSSVQRTQSSSAYQKNYFPLKKWAWMFYMYINIER